MGIRENYVRPRKITYALSTCVPMRLGIYPHKVRNHPEYTRSDAPGIVAVIGEPGWALQ